VKPHEQDWTYDPATLTLREYHSGDEVDLADPKNGMLAAFAPEMARLLLLVITSKADETTDGNRHIRICVSREHATRAFDVLRDAGVLP
jgi:hypothetical protein